MAQSVDALERIHGANLTALDSFVIYIFTNPSQVFAAVAAVLVPMLALAAWATWRLLQDDGDGRGKGSGNDSAAEVRYAVSDWAARISLARPNHAPERSTLHVAQESQAGGAARSAGGSRMPALRRRK